MCLYSKLGGQATRHSAVTDSSIVTALSHISVQVFGHSHDRWFTHVPEEAAQLQTRHFAMLLPQNLLLPLRSPVITNSTQLVEVSSEDIKEFSEMTDRKQCIEAAISGYKQNKDS